MSVRFTAYLSESERDGIADLAKKHGTSENYIVRLSVRQMLGLSVPDKIPQAPEPVTGVTRNQ